MSQKFDWQSEEEDSWDDYASSEVEQGNTSRKRRWWLTLLVIPLLLGGAILAFRQLEDFTLAAEMTAENDIISSSNLVQAAAMDADGELLSTVLSGRDPAWTRTQLVLVNGEEFFDRKPFGLIWQPQASPTEVQVTVSPDFSDAVVATRHKYKLEERVGSSQDITLEQSSVFRRGDDRWLMSPPIGDYWGEPITINGRFLSLTFPSRDEAIGRRLAADLEEVLSSACNNLDGLECGPDTHLFVHLDTDPQSMIDMAKAETRLRITQDLFLPTPTLVGTPIDESGYRAIYRGYARTVVSSFLGQVAGWNCCDHLLFYQALLDLQLAELGLVTWPIVEDQYQLLLDGRGELSEVLWSGNESPSELLEWPDSWQAYVIVEYIVTDWADVPLIEMQRNLTRFTFFSEWLESVSREGTERTFPIGWHSFLQRRVDGT
jgi:hypothetical protein